MAHFFSAMSSEEYPPKTTLSFDRFYFNSDGLFYIHNSEFKSQTMKEEGFEIIF